ncbi:hypothetical protein HDU86_005101 [Geranomyces michiganensis]|nr:hypothetical protein HDU86_005101 [Geranomyces michiganensis]
MSDPRQVRADAREIEILGYIFGAFFVLGSQNLLTNIAQVRQHTQVLYKISLVASILQLLDVLFLAIQNSLQVDAVSRCHGIVNFGSSCYYVFQILSTAITIYRGTTLLSEWWKRISRVGMTLMLTLSIILNSVNFMILVTFLIPIARHFKNLAQHNVTGKNVRNVAIAMAAKIALVIVALGITISLSFGGIFGSYFYIEFLIENFCWYVYAGGQDFQLVRLNNCVVCTLSMYKPDSIDVVLRSTT